MAQAPDLIFRAWQLDQSVQVVYPSKHTLTFDAEDGMS